MSSENTTMPASPATIEHRTLDSQQVEVFKTRNNRELGVIQAVKDVRFGIRADGVSPYVLVICENGAGVLVTPESEVAA